MTTKQKIFIVDGVNTLFSNGYFVRDDIPRHLASYMDMGYSIWILTMSPDEHDMWDELTMPDWLKQNCFVMDTDLFNELKKSTFDSQSMFVTNNPDITQFYDLKMKIKTPNEVFKCEEYVPLNIADVILCFGFTEHEFTKFYQESHLIGVMNKNFHNLIGNKADGIAVFIDENMSDLKNSYEKILDILNGLLEEKKYKIKHNSKILGVTYKGQGIENMNMNILENKSIPLLLL